MNDVDARSYAILAALIDQPRHGYAILKQIETLFPTVKRPAVATLYATLDRLAAEGFVEIFSEEIVDGRARRVFALTKIGREGLRAEAERMADAARVVKRQLVASSQRSEPPRRRPRNSRRGVTA